MKFQSFQFFSILRCTVALQILCFFFQIINLPPNLSFPNALSCSGHITFTWPPYQSTYIQSYLIPASFTSPYGDLWSMSYVENRTQHFFINWKLHFSMLFQTPSALPLSHIPCLPTPMHVWAWQATSSMLLCRFLLFILHGMLFLISALGNSFQPLGPSPNISLLWSIPQFP